MSKEVFAPATHKEWYESQTIQFFILVLATGGFDLVEKFVQDQSVSWRTLALLITGLAGIGLRLRTRQPIK